MIKDPNIPIWQLTIGEFMELLESVKNDQQVPIQQIQTKEYVYGIPGLADIIGCSVSHTNRLKKMGVFKDAIIQNGRKIMTDKEKAIELYKKYGENEK